MTQHAASSALKLKAHSRFRRNKYYASRCRRRCSSLQKNSPCEVILSLFGKCTLQWAQHTISSPAVGGVSSCFFFPRKWFLIAQKTSTARSTKNISLPNAIVSVAASKLVGVRGFEPPTPASRTQYSTRLSYTPKMISRSRYELLGTCSATCLLSL